MSRPRVLMIAYACDPQGGGEHWLGWGWAEQASHNYEVELLTTAKAQPNVERACRQKRILSLAERLHRQKPFALVHQTTFHTFRVPFRAADLGIPSVWGPIAGGERVPPGFERYLGSAKLG